MTMYLLWPFEILFEELLVVVASLDAELEYLMQQLIPETLLQLLGLGIAVKRGEDLLLFFIRSRLIVVLRQLVGEVLREKCDLVG